MEAARPPALTPVAAAAVAAGRESPPPVRLPEGVYRRRRLLVALIAVAASTLVLVAGRAERIPPGEANPWPVAGEALPAGFTGVYVVQAGDTLWDIALALAPGEDPRSLVHELAEAAGGAVLEPGQPIDIGAVPALLAARGSERRPARSAADALAVPAR